MYHPGPEFVYLAKVPSGRTAANWDGSGAVWFKIYQRGPTFGSQLGWPNMSMSTDPFDNFLALLPRIHQTKY